MTPGLSRLFLDYCSGSEAARPFYAALPSSTAWQDRPSLPAHWQEFVGLLAGQNSSPSPAAAAALEALGNGAGVVVTGQQVGLFGGPLFTPFKAATALAHARRATAEGHPHAAIFWLASEDHDFAEIDHAVFPTRKELRTLVYGSAPATHVPVGGIVLDESITPLVEQARELLGASEATEALAAAYQPGRSLAQAFREFYSRAFAAQGLLVLDAGSREFHRLGAPVFRAAIERADELHAALMERNRELDAAGYHAQVAVGGQSSLLFLIEEGYGARLALKRTVKSAQEPGGLWQTNGPAGPRSYSTSDLLGILDAEPERISPSALLRPVFQDFMLSTSLTVGGPAEIAYFAQSAVLFERILGRVTPNAPRFSGTLIEPAIGELLRKHNLTIEQVFAETQASLAQLLAERSMAPETRQKLETAGTALETELTALVEWMRATDAGLGQAAETSAGKVRYQMDRLRTLAMNFQLQREATFGRHAASLAQALYPGGVLQERVHAAAHYFARYGFGLAEELVEQAGNSCPGHVVMWL